MSAFDDYRDLCEERDQLRARVADLEAAAKDAARYRWLRDGNYDKDTEATHIAVNMFGFEWDDAIDAAILSADTEVTK